MRLNYTGCYDSFEYQARSTRTGRLFNVTFSDGVGWDADGSAWRPGHWPEDPSYYYNDNVEFFKVGTFADH